MPSTHACLSGEISTFLLFGPARPSAGSSSVPVQESREDERIEDTLEPPDGGVSSWRRALASFGVVGVRLSTGEPSDVLVRAKAREEPGLLMAESGLPIGVDLPAACALREAIELFELSFGKSWISIRPSDADLRPW